MCGPPTRKRRGARGLGRQPRQDRRAQARHRRAGPHGAGAATDLSAIRQRVTILLAFEEELAGGSAAAQGAMESAIQRLGMEVALDIGAKVAKGEMKWG